MKKFVQKRKVIFVSIPTDERAERLKFEGVLSYAHEKRNGKWRVETDPGGLLPHIAAEFERFRYDGIIAYVKNAKTREILASLPCPKVLIEDLEKPKEPLSGPQTATILCDHAAEGRAAARHLMSRHLASFAWIGPVRKVSWADQRKLGFAKELADHGFRCRSYPRPTGEARSNFAVEIHQLANWLAKLPRPAGVFVCRDARARQVVAAADEAMLPIPNGLAVLGVDDDEIVCTTTEPALSSVATTDRRIGYSAGRILNDLLRQRDDGRVIRTYPPHVVTRMSTEIEASNDEIVAKVLRYASKNLREKLTTDRLAQLVNVTRHDLQLRADQALGMPIGKAIQQMRLKAAVAMLTGSDKSVADIASSCGYVCMSYMSVCTKAAYGLTPLQIRLRDTGRR